MKLLYIELSFYHKSGTIQSCQKLENHQLRKPTDLFYFVLPIPIVNSINPLRFPFIQYYCIKCWNYNMQFSNWIPIIIRISCLNIVFWVVCCVAYTNINSNSIKIWIGIILVLKKSLLDNYLFTKYEKCWKKLPLYNDRK